MKYLISTNREDYVFERKRAATTWLKELNSQNPKIKTLWVYDHTGMWIDAATINDEGKVVKSSIYPDGALRIWVIWACRIFDNNSSCESFEDAYWLSQQLRNVEREMCKGYGYVSDYKEFTKAAKGCYTF